jgi:hypothetical protein
MIVKYSILIVICFPLNTTTFAPKFSLKTEFQNYYTIDVPNE